MSVTLKDVAEKAGVSISTVSRILNNDRSRPASEKTQEKVWQVVKELGYRPNQSAVNLIKGQKKTKKEKYVGLLHLACPFSMNDPFYKEIMAGAQKELIESELAMGLSMTVTSKNYESLYKIITKKALDGLVVFGRINREMIEYFNQYPGILVHVGDEEIEANWHQITVNGKKAIETIINEFSQAEDEWGYIGEVDHSYNQWFGRKYRYTAFLETLKAMGVNLNPDLVIESRSQIESAYNAVKRVTNGPYASKYFCGSDYIAMGAIKAFNEKGIRVPEDIEIISMDNIEMSKYFIPSLTTVSIPTDEMGRYAVTLLKEQLEREGKSSVKMELPFEIIKRESTR